MSQHDYTVDNGSGAAVRADLNSVLGAIASNNGGSVTPSPTFAHQWWMDESTNLLKIRNSTNSAWVTVAEKNGANWTPYVLGSAINDYITATVRGYTKQQYPVLAALTDAATITWNLDNAQAAEVTLSGNRTLQNPTNMKAGASYILHVKQDTHGNRTLTYDTAYLWPGGTPPVLSVGVQAEDIIAFWSDGTFMYGNAVKDFA